MKTHIGLVIQRLKILSDLVELESNTTDDLYRGDLHGQIVNAQEIMKSRVEPRPCRAAMLAFLDALPEGYVLAIAALMYAGRDNDGDVIANWKGFGGLNRKHAIQAIAEKTPRMQYIETAMALLPSSALLGELPEAIMR